MRVTLDRMDFEAIIVGGGAAGLSAALALGRGRRRTLVVDAGGQSNLPAHGIGGLLGHDGRPPAELYALGRAELAAYPAVEVRDGEVVAARRDGDAFVLDLADGGTATAGRVLLATGMDYEHADVPGLTERWGRSVFHCPFCHGWEVREQPLGVLDSGVHRALLLRAWSDDVVLLTDGPAELSAGDRAALDAAGVPVDERPLTAVDDAATVHFDEGAERVLGGLLVAITLRHRSPLAQQLGAATGEPTPLQAEPLVLTPMRETTVPGLFAAGDLGPEPPSVANAIASGAHAAAAIMQRITADLGREPARFG